MAEGLSAFDALHQFRRVVRREWGLQVGAERTMWELSYWTAVCKLLCLHKYIVTCPENCVAVHCDTDLKLIRSRSNSCRIS